MVDARTDIAFDRGRGAARAVGPLGGETGRRLSLAVAAGPWLGPVGLRLGPVAAWDRADWGDEVVLGNAWLVGAGLDLSAAAGPFAATVGMEPVWLAAGTRGAATQALASFPVIGHETSWRAGVGWLGRPVEVFVDGDARETARGTVFAASLSFHLKVL